MSQPNYMDYLMLPHTAIITGATGCGKTHFVLDLLQFGAYKNYFDVVIVLCPTFLYNETYMSGYNKTFGAKKINNGATHFYWWHFPNRDPTTNHLGEAISTFSEMFLGCEVLFLIDDMAADSGIVIKRGSLNELAISSRHTKRSLWVLTQKYNSVGKDVREQSMWLCSFYCKDANSFKDMLDENDVKMSKEEKEMVKEILFDNKRSKLLLKCFQPVGWHMLT